MREMEYEMKATEVARWEIEESVTGDAGNERTGNRKVSHLAKMFQHHTLY
jgi:hypothetical protein